MNTKTMPIYEYVVEQCVESLYCPKRFAFRQLMSDPPVTECVTCGAALTRVLSSFSAGEDLVAHMAALADLPADSLAPPATLQNMFGGGLGDLGCGHRHPDGLLDSGAGGRGCGGG
ncbi:MAG: zinc ribbon domain-containing protein [Nitrospirota bacterium]|nr:zinc ribbon domain-containing protein [Nitrospirota bacterium]